MLYKFQCKKAPDVLMLEDLTNRIFKVLNRPLTEKGAFLVEQLPEAIRKLEEAIAIDDANHKELENFPGNIKSTKTDRLGQRAFPFITLLKAAWKEQEIIVWGV